jgi:hypothetical protein
MIEGIVKITVNIVNKSPQESTIIAEVIFGLSH